MSPKVYGKSCLDGVHIGSYIGDYYEGDTRSLEYSSCSLRGFKAFTGVGVSKSLCPAGNYSCACFIWVDSLV